MWVVRALWIASGALLPVLANIARSANIRG